MNLFIGPCIGMRRRALVAITGDPGCRRLAEVRQREGRGRPASLVAGHSTRPASTGCSLVGTFHRRVARHNDQRGRARRCGGTAAVLGLADPDCGLAAETLRQRASRQGHASVAALLRSLNQTGFQQHVLPPVDCGDDTLELCRVCERGRKASVENVRDVRPDQVEMSVDSTAALPPPPAVWQRDLGAHGTPQIRVLRSSTVKPSNCGRRLRPLGARAAQATVGCGSNRPDARTPNIQDAFHAQVLRRVGPSRSRLEAPRRGDLLCGAGATRGLAWEALRRTFPSVSACARWPPSRSSYPRPTL